MKEPARRGRTLRDDQQLPLHLTKSTTVIAQIHAGTKHTQKHTYVDRRKSREFARDSD